MLDIYRLNAVLTELLKEGETFDPALALELFEAIPESNVPSIRMRSVSRRPRNSKKFTGFTNLGNVDLDEDEPEEKRWSSSSRQGLWVGKWILTRVDNILSIDPRFGGPFDDSYCLALRGNSVEFVKLVMRRIGISLPSIGWKGWRPYIDGWYTCGMGYTVPHTWKRPACPDEIENA